MDIDYAKAGLKSGLEIHQQLDTGKLFCNCPSVLRNDEPDLIVTRKLHAVAGESGEVDVAAKHEASKDKEFEYQYYSDTNCLVELDEEPPHEINFESLNIALQVALKLNCMILPLTQIMRKTVVDGSNTSGFQRSVLIGLNGYLETSLGRVGIDSVALEEDAARIVSREKKKDVYRLDRLGIPLVEIATAPDMKTSEQIKETALKIGEILRSLKVRRGIGTIRQDVNVSIKKGARVEIKGFQDPKMMIKTIDGEILRQQKIVDSGKNVENEVRKALPNGETEFLRPMPGAARMYPETDLPLLKISRSMIDEAKKNLPLPREEIERELQKKGLAEDSIRMLFKQNKLELFKELLNIIDDANFVAKVILMFPKDLASRAKKTLEEVETLLEDNFGSILLEVKKQKLSLDDVKAIMTKLVEGVDFAEAIKIEKFEAGDVEERIMKIVKEKPGLAPNAYMGLVMKEFGGKIEGKTAMEIIKKYAK